MLGIFSRPRSWRSPALFPPPAPLLHAHQQPLFSWPSSSLQAAPGPNVAGSNTSQQNPAPCSDLPSAMGLLLYHPSPHPPRTLRCRAGVQPCASSSPSAPAAKLQVTSAESPPLPARRHPSDDAAALYIAWGGSASGCGAGPAAVPMPGAPYGAGAVHSA